MTTSPAHDQLIAEAEMARGRLLRRDRDLDVLLRSAATDLAAAVAEAAGCPDAARARDLWMRCAEAEEVVGLALREARRRRRISSFEHDRAVGAFRLARRFRNLAYQATRGEAFASTLQ